MKGTVACKQPPYRPATLLLIQKTNKVKVTSGYI